MKKRNERRKQSLRLTDKKHPPMGIAATVIGFLSAILFCMICYISGLQNGKSGIVIGIGGLGCFLLSIIGFCMTWISLKQENIRTLFPTIAAVINGLLVVMYSFVYIWGTVV